MQVKLYLYKNTIKHIVNTKIKKHIFIKISTSRDYIITNENRARRYMQIFMNRIEPIELQLSFRKKYKMYTLLTFKENIRDVRLYLC